MRTGACSMVGPISLEAPRRCRHSDAPAQQERHPAGTRPGLRLSTGNAKGRRGRARAAVRRAPGTSEGEALLAGLAFTLCMAVRATQWMPAIATLLAETTRGGSGVKRSFGPTACPDVTA